MNSDKRAYQRQATMGLMSALSDGKASFLGVVEDISTTGMCMSQVPAVFDDSVESCYTVVKGPVSDFKVVMRPCWVRPTNRGMYKVIGFHIEDPTESWINFVDQISSEKDPFHALVADKEEKYNQKNLKFAG